MKWKNVHDIRIFCMPIICLTYLHYIDLHIRFIFNHSCLLRLERSRVITSLNFILCTLLGYVDKEKIMCR